MPVAVTLSVTNPLSGTPGGDAETEESFRARVLQAGLAASQGMPSYLKTELQNLPGVVSRLVGIIVTLGVGVEVLCGGGDNYQIANAIFQSVFNPSALLGSTTHVVVTNPSIAPTTASVAGGSLAGATYYAKYTYTDALGNQTLASPETSQVVASSHLLQITSPAPSTGAFYWDAYASMTTGTETLQQSGIPIGTNWLEPVSGLITGAVVPVSNTTATANVTVTLNNYPDNYDIIFVSPVEQIVTISLTWNTLLSSFAQADAVNQITVQPIADYINSIGVGAPINLLELNNTFAVAVSAILDISNVDKLDWTVTINGNPASPVAGETIIESDPESYFTIQNTAITVMQG